MDEKQANINYGDSGGGLSGMQNKLKAKMAKNEREKERTRIEKEAKTIEKARGKKGKKKKGKISKVRFLF